MKINQRRVQLIERLANYYRHRQSNRAKERHDIQVSKSQHPSRARSVHRSHASLEEIND